jgi:hypothetical protein
MYVSCAVRQTVMLHKPAFSIVLSASGELPLQGQEFFQTQSCSLVGSRGQENLASQVILYI